MKCPDCGTEMRPLAFSMYCPNDCDRKVREEIDPEKTPRMVLSPTVSSSQDDEEDPDWSWIDKMSWDFDTD